MVLVYPRVNAVWGPGAQDDPDFPDVWRRKAHWSFRPGGPDATPETPYPGWANISDVKFRNTASLGAIALVCASAGEGTWGRAGAHAGILDVNDVNRHPTHEQLIWDVDVGGNPHAIERIPDNGSVVVASSQDVVGVDGGGFLSLYAPRVLADPSTLGRVATIPFEKAHGVLWDPANKWLWAIGKNELRTYAVEGSLVRTRLRLVTSQPLYEADRPEPDVGHDLMADYLHQHNLLMTATHGAYVFGAHPGSGGARWARLSGEKKLKSLTRHAGGEFIWVHGEPQSPTDLWPHTNPYVYFGKSLDTSPVKRGWDTARIYKARLWTTAIR
ncbi:hypothetical protein [Streptomyces pakalii]|uniref:Uncharacterized protein n=1 Tax=Streptomyces pakalii TaxID=3036494 RepID=A0ABT7DHH5_9ACTN|nr:hypothetical protein [Streptomyces pakalii]MDJ1645282.1 hypothetical protein [Streptomyces pakalii]